MKYLAKIADAEIMWQDKASRIRSGQQKSMLTILEERGLIQTVTGHRQWVDKMMTDKRLGAYVGIDPTAASLHVGHLIPLMSIFWMFLHGYHTVSLLGGATSKIGDPTDRLTTREKEHSSIRTANMVKMHLQLKKLWFNVEQYGIRHGFEKEWAWHRELVNNNEWWNKLPMLEVLQVMGPGVRLGSMLARDTVKNKMSKGDGMSFAEFTYPVMQAWDWWHMYRTKGIQVQIGGSDQFGNITAGIDAVKYVAAHHPDPVAREEARAVGEPFGFTGPLLTTASGQKFGKSAGNAIWLDNEETSAFQLYGYFLRTSDLDVEKYLKMFTFLPLEEITALVEEHKKSPEQRKAQHKLAREFLELVHGEHEAKMAESQHRTLFSKGAGQPLLSEIDADAKAGIVTPNNRPKVNVKLPRNIIYQKSISKVLYAVGLVSSGSEGHRLVESKGAYVGGRNPSTPTAMNDGGIAWVAIKNWAPEELKTFLIHDDLLLFRRAKHDVRIVQVVSDEEYVMSGEKFPGMKASWKREVLERMTVKASVDKEERAAIEELLRSDAPWAKNLAPEDEDQPAKKKAVSTRIRHIHTEKKAGVKSNLWDDPPGHQE